MEELSEYTSFQYGYKAHFRIKPLVWHQTESGTDSLILIVWFWSKCFCPALMILEN